MTTESKSQTPAIEKLASLTAHLKHLTGEHGAISAALTEERRTTFAASRVGMTVDTLLHDAMPNHILQASKAYLVRRAEFHARGVRLERMREIHDEIERVCSEINHLMPSALLEGRRFSNKVYLAVKYFGDA